MNKIKQFIKKDRNIIMASLLIGLVITIIVSGTRAYAIETQKNIAKEFIRFHVLANSDSEADQALKRAVKDAVLEDMKDVLEKSETKLETRAQILNHQQEIKRVAEQVISDWGKDYEVKVNLGQSMFPTKQYGDVVLPAGQYEALRIEIGKAEGHNWWCVMFPPLCFVDVTHEIIPESMKKDLKEILSEDDYELVLATRKDGDVPVKIKLKVVELWQEQFYRNHSVILTEKDVKQEEGKDLEQEEAFVNEKN